MHFTLRSISFILCSLISIQSFAQLNVQGKILDENTNKAIPYVNIGIVGESIGTVSDEKGNFELIIPNIHTEKQIIFSAIGFENFETQANNLPVYLENNSSIVMRPVTYNIEEIVVTKDKLKSKTLGNKVTKNNVQSGYEDNILGCEVATKINLKRKEQVLLDKFKFAIAHNTCDSLFFRLNLYESKNGKPGKNITRQNIFITTNIESGVVEVDLKEYDIWMKDDFYIGLEWIKNFCPESEKGGFNFASKFFKKLHYKPAGQANWKKLSIAGAGMWVEVFSCKKD